MSEEATPDAGVSKPNDRDDYMKQLAELARNERDGVQEEQEEQPEEVEEEAQEEVAETPEVEPDFVTLKVEGEEKQVERDKVYEAGIRALQKESAADKRLQEATKILEQAKESQKALPEVESDEPEYTPEQLAHALQYGDDDEAVNAIKLILEGRKTEQVATPNREEVNQQIDIRTEFNEAVKEFKTEFSEIWNDPKLRELATQKERALREAGDNRPFAEVYKEVGTEIREWVGQFKEPTKSGLEKRKARKQSIDNVEGASAPVGKSKQPAKPKTPEDVLNDLRKARGQL